ncbi:hypothetical protein [Variovorax sp. PBL-E5]|uniref:hypothetical protein n=1 Tax=Variovorax sp. PBL-E5 TaxID=434014 RepID=UPI0013A53E6B|nr:hypothetical protein [Variovorax sp. PBL-E5]
MNVSWTTITRSLVLLVLCWNMSNASEAACTLPWPDTYRPGTSNPNVVGKVITVSNAQIDLQTRNGRQRIGLPPSGVYYTAFGGDDRIDNLKLGLIARAWYVDCKVPKDGAVPKAAYLEVYSNDPDDRPPPSYWKRY